MTAWAELDKVSVGKPRPDGGATLVLQDGRTAAQIGEHRLISILVAMCRVTRAREALGKRFAGKGVVYYVVRGTPPSYLVEAVTTAGGVVFDGSSEHVAPSPMDASMLLDATLLDLATAVRRRINVRTFRDALEVREHELHRRAVPRSDSVAWWTAVFELCALAGELYRAERPGTWTLAAAARPPLGMRLARLPGMPATTVHPGEAAMLIADGQPASLRTLVDLATPQPPGAPLATNLRAMPLLVDRRTRTLDGATWELLVGDDVDHEELPVIVYVEDRGDAVYVPTGQGAPTRPIRERALANLARAVFALERREEPELPVALVALAHASFAAEALLHRPTMQKIEELLATDALVIGIPSRGQLLAIAMTESDDEVFAFLRYVERVYLAASDEQRVASDAVHYAEGRPLGRVRSSQMETRRALRRMGIDPDA